MAAEAQRQRQRQRQRDARHVGGVARQKQCPARRHGNGGPLAGAQPPARHSAVPSQAGNAELTMPGAWKRT
ncbi:MAG: hypothetical protein KGL48_14555 [Sphingomonadales bacterium]|nr:hypothetical protein [Sphingomonadales bacterium]MDE2568530.1 hypothetical protein [Sphingomonadales bacterium]